MNAPIRELPRTEVPRPLVLVTATICGVLAAIAAQIVLANAVSSSRHVAGNRREGFHLRAAGAWWMMAGTALLVGAAVAAALRRTPCPGWGSGCCAGLPAPPWSPLVPDIAHAAAMKSGVAVGIHLAAASFAAVFAAALTALFEG